MPKEAIFETKFTVIICTKNRLEHLKQTVDCILLRLARYCAAKLVIVDNGSTDDTAEYLRDLSARDERLITFHEATPGLYYARLRGLSYAWGDLFIFVDDDVLPDDTWPSAVIEEFANHPEVGMLGTAVDALWLSPRPPWMTDWLSDRFLALRPAGRTVCRFPHCPMGASMAGRRINHIIMLYASPERHQLPLDWGVITKYGEVAGGDNDLAELYIRNGFQVVLLDHVRVKHMVLSHKVTLPWIYKKFMSDGQLRIRYTRLANLSYSWRTAAQILLFPILWLYSSMLKLLQVKSIHAIRMEAYSKRAQGMWIELLWGPRDIRYPFSVAEK